MREAQRTGKNKSSGVYRKTLKNFKKFEISIDTAYKIWYNLYYLCKWGFFFVFIYKREAKLKV
jgi:hypothetical protein